VELIRSSGIARQKVLALIPRIREVRLNDAASRNDGLNRRPEIAGNKRTGERDATSVQASDSVQIVEGNSLLTTRNVRVVISRLLPQDITLEVTSGSAPRKAIDVNVKAADNAFTSLEAADNDGGLESRSLVEERLLQDTGLNTDSLVVVRIGEPILSVNTAATTGNLNSFSGSRGIPAIAVLNTPARPIQSNTSDVAKADTRLAGSVSVEYHPNLHALRGSRDNWLHLHGNEVRHNVSAGKVRTLERLDGVVGAPIGVIIVSTTTNTMVIAERS